MTDPFPFDEQPLIIQDMLTAIDEDKWIYGVTWGDPRTGKSTCCMDLAYNVYGSWELVLQAIVWNLNQLLYKMKHGIPELRPTRNGLHNRVPIIIWDDFAAHSGKAKTQHEKSWDIFKGAFDTLGTKMGVLILNMVSPNAPTQQLAEKYTHEIWIPERGFYKYDRVTHRQDYRGFSPQLRKRWLDEGEFPEMPMEWFRQYDEMRMQLADEVLQAVEDSLVETHMPTLMKRTGPLDFDLLALIKARGDMKKRDLVNTLGPDTRNAIIRCKSRGLLVPVRKGPNYYRYDLTSLALELLKTKDKAREEAIKAKETPALIVPKSA